MPASPDDNRHENDARAIAELQIAIGRLSFVAATGPMNNGCCSTVFAVFGPLPSDFPAGSACWAPSTSLRTLRRLWRPTGPCAENCDF